MGCSPELPCLKLIRFLPDIIHAELSMVVQFILSNLHLIIKLSVFSLFVCCLLLINSAPLSSNPHDMYSESG